MVYDPVCCADEINYSNQGAALCDGFLYCIADKCGMGGVEPANENGGDFEITGGPDTGGTSDGNNDNNVGGGDDVDDSSGGGVGSGGNENEESL